METNIKFEWGVFPISKVLFCFPDNLVLYSSIQNSLDLTLEEYYIVRTKLAA